MPALEGSTVEVVGDSFVGVRARRLSAAEVWVGVHEAAIEKVGTV